MLKLRTLRRNFFFLPSLLCFSRPRRVLNHDLVVSVLFFLLQRFPWSCLCVLSSHLLIVTVDFVASYMTLHRRGAFWHRLHDMCSAQLCHLIQKCLRKGYVGVDAGQGWTWRRLTKTWRPHRLCCGVAPNLAQGCPLQVARDAFRRTKLCVQFRRGLGRRSKCCAASSFGNRRPSMWTTLRR